MKLHEYEFQNEAVAEIVKAAKSLLASPVAGAVLLDAPTGAGKTVTAAKALAKLSDEFLGPLSFIWIAPNTLQDQSRAKLLSIYGEKRSLACVTAEELRSSEIEDRAILFLNWASVNKPENVLRRDDTGSETGRTLKEILANTRTAGRRIVLVVDESHRDINGVQAQIVVQNIIAPDLTLEISATPVLKDAVVPVTIDRAAVVKAGVIRKQFVINPGVKGSLSIEGGNVNVEGAGSAESLLDVALTLRAQLAAAFKLEAERKRLANPNGPSVPAVNPLVLLQLPEKGTAPADVRERIEDHLHRKHGVSIANGKLAVQLSEEKVNVDNLKENDSPVDMLFFKQSIATGWDCPRAHILVSLWEMKSPTFTAQVLGRILRQPEHHHYDDALLDSAYVFTNYSQFTLEKQFESVMATRLVTADTPVEFPLPFWRETNADQRLYLTDAAYRAIVAHAKFRLGDIQYRGPVTGAMVSDLAVEDVNWVGEERKRSYRGDATYHLDEEKLEEELRTLVTQYVAKTAAQVDGRKHVRRALLEIASQVKPNATDMELREVVLHEGNRAYFDEIVGVALAEQWDEFEGKARTFALEPKWTPKGNKVMPWSKSLEGFEKCVYSPVLAAEFFRKDLPGKVNETELAFARLLDKHPEVKAWLKNGDRGTEYFAIPYELDGKARLFFPDFLAVLTGGRFGIWDTKGHGDDGTAALKSTVAKATALAQYRLDRAKEGITVVGGMVVKDAAGRWMLNDSFDYRWNHQLTGWSSFLI